MTATKTAAQPVRCSNPLGDEDPPIHILVGLQGGGALGAFEVGVLEHLQTNLDVSQQVSAVSGVSFGAINAAIYAANIHDDPIGALKEFYNELTFVDSPLYQLFKFNPLRNTPFDGILLDQSIPANILAPILNPNFYNMRFDVWTLPFWTYILDNSNLGGTLARVINLDKLNSIHNPQLILTAMDIESGELKVFNNRTHTLGYEHVLASASLPPMFRPTIIDNKSFWDGGVFDNSPFQTLLLSLMSQDLWDYQDPTKAPGTYESPTQKRLITVELVPRGSSVPVSFLETMNRLLQMILRNKFTAQTRDGIYEFGAVVNWLARFVSLLAKATFPQPDRLPKDHLVSPAVVKEFQKTIKDDLGLDDDEFRTEMSRLAWTLVKASQKAMNLYFEAPRPGFPIPQDPQCPIEAGYPVVRLQDWETKRLSGMALGAIQRFASRGQDLLHTQEAGKTPKSFAGQQNAEEALMGQAANYFNNLRTSDVFIDQITRFVNIELFPIKANFPTEILSIGDYTPGSLRSLYEQGIQTAAEQIIVAEYQGKDDDGKTPKTRRDLQYLPPAE
jgi:predicted acylesterase/phospholipase RssA